MTPTLVWEIAERDRAGWIAGAVDEFGVVLPSAFPARARVPDPDREALPALLPHLSGATTTPAECVFAVWTGYGGMLRFGDAARLRLGHRDYQLYRGALGDVGELASAVYPPGAPNPATANIAWPRDGAWVLATEVDLDATYVAGAAELVEAIAADPTLAAVRE